MLFFFFLLLAIFPLFVKKKLGMIAFVECVHFPRLHTFPLGKIVRFFSCVFLLLLSFFFISFHSVDVVVARYIYLQIHTFVMCCAHAEFLKCLQNRRLFKYIDKPNERANVKIKKKNKFNEKSVIRFDVCLNIANNAYVRNVHCV